MANNESNEAVNPLPENQAECEDEIAENDTSGRVWHLEPGIQYWLSLISDWPG